MTDSSPESFDQLLRGFEHADEEARASLFEHVYEELRSLARRMMNDAGDRNTLQPTALVHEAWERLGGADDVAESPRHFKLLVARAMRRVLIDRARARTADKRGGGHERVTLAGLEAEYTKDPIDAFDLHNALVELGQTDELLENIVELRWFGGFTEREAAEALGLERSQVQRKWRLARLLLSQRLRPPES